jgi:hypothetical protein
VNTAPAMPSRELAALLIKQAGGFEWRITDESEVYSVWDNVWSKAGMEPGSGCLCIGCLEHRLGRRLKPKDFPADDEFNHPNFPGTPRLLDRRGKR